MNYKTVFLFGIMAAAAALSGCAMPTEIQAEGEGSSPLTPGTGQPQKPVPVDDTNLTPYLDAPAGGAQAPSSLKGSPSQYSGSVAWTANNADLEADDTFTHGMDYTATVTLKAANGYTFTGAGKFSHDAAGCTVSQSDTASGSITVTIIFPATFYTGSFSGNPETGGGGDSVIDLIRAAAVNNREALYVQLAQEEGESEEVTLTSDNTNDIGAGLLLDSANSPGKVFIDGGGLTVKLSSATPEKHSTPLITVGEDITLTLRNITFTGLPKEKNYASSLIKVESGGTLILEDGAGIKNAVRGWFADIPGAGGVTVFGTLIMNGGEISGNGTTSGNNNGGGVYVGAGGEFTMNDGTISNNTVRDAWGGGVYVPGGTFTMKGGTISGNSAKLGGGVFVLDGSTFTMTGGTVKDNHTVDVGGGVVVYNSAFKKTGGTIYGDDADGEALDPATGKPLKNTSGVAYGHAVYAENSGAAPLELKRNSTAGTGVNMYFSVPDEEDSGWEQ